MPKIKFEKKYIHYLIFLAIILLNVFLVSNILKSNIHGKFDASDIANTTNYETDGNVSEHTRYISEETMDSLDDNSKWKTDEKLKKELEDTLKTNPDDVQEHIVEKIGSAHV